jgi:hypothetical protein
MVSFTPVVERTSVGARPPWPVLGDAAAYLVPLSADATDTEVGSVVWQLAQYNSVPVEGLSTPEIVRASVTAKRVVLPGGILVRDATGREVPPGCCAGLEEWREWLAFEETGATPWMGHSPDAWLERVGDAVRIWSDGGMSDGAKESAFSIEVPIIDFRRGLTGVQHDLRGFLGALRRWAAGRVPAEAESLAARFDQAFEITGARPRDPAT